MNANKTYVNSVLKRQFHPSSADLDYDGAVLWVVDAIKNLPKKKTLVVSLIGGAASGKSTLVQSLRDGLAAAGMNADVLATDDFNKGDRAWRKEQYDDKAAAPSIDPKEIDPLRLKDFELLNRKINDIKAIADPDGSVAVPTYDPLTGVAIDEGEVNYKHRIGPVDVLFIEGDFDCVSEPDLIVFMHLSDEDRLQNRVNRDAVARGGEAAKTIESFNFRQRYQHDPLTLPVIEKADVVLDISISGSAWHYRIYTKNT